MMNTKLEPRHKLHYLYVFSDFIITFSLTFLVFFYTFWLKNFVFESQIVIISISLSFAIALLIVLFYQIFGIYKMMIRHFGIPEALKMFIIVIGVECLGLVAFLIVRGLTNYLNGVSLFSWILCGLFLSFLLPSMRLYARFKNLFFALFRKKKNVRTLVIGAGASAKIVVDEFNRNKELHNNICAFVDDDQNKIGKTFANKPIVGPISNVAYFVEKYKATEVIIAISKLTKERKKEILSQLSNCPVRIKKLPVLSEMDGPHDKKIVDIDIDELLGREKVILDNKLLQDVLNDKVVLITGAGGSIGSELSRQIFMSKPRTLVLFDIYENSTYEIEQELKTIMRQLDSCSTKVVTLIGSTYNEKTVDTLFKKYRPDYIYHAAAYKHVPLMEDSPIEAIRTNILGTYNVAKAADKYHSKKMVLISTDKAVRPTNVMGATKRYAEAIIQYYASISKNTIYAAVRFGNVLGSNGSVVPLFKKQIEQGGPITITDNNIIRYFMTIPEAVSLVLQCGLFAEGGEIFILDMGKPVKIMDLAIRMIRQAGLVPDVDIKIIETGLRPGEKLYEELLLDKEKHEKTANEKIFIERNTEIRPIEEEMIDIEKFFNLSDNDEVKEKLSKIVKDYRSKV